MTATTKRIEELTDVPADELEQTTREFEAAGGKVAATRQSDGKWTLTATFVDSA